MAKWAEIKCERCAEADALWEGMERALEESDAREARSRRWREDLERWLEESETREATLNDRITMLEAKLAQQDDDDFYPASAGDDPIWLGGVEYITKFRSDDLVQAAFAAALREAAERMRHAAATEDDLGRTINAAIFDTAVKLTLALITPDAQAALDRMVAAERERWQSMSMVDFANQLTTRSIAAIREEGE